MKFSKEDQNTFILIITILVVSIITIIVVLNIIWGLLIHPVESTVEKIAAIFKVHQELSYNFEVPNVQAATITQLEPPPIQVQQAEAQQDQQIQLPYYEAKSIASTNSGNTPIVKEAESVKHLSGVELNQVRFFVEIPLIKMYAPAMQGHSTTKILERGFFIYPGSNLTEQGETIIMCYREQFNSTDPRSCWNLDLVEIDDEIKLHFGEFITNYRVIGKNIFEEGDAFIYTISNESNYLKIVTNTIENGVSKRLVLLAEKTSN